jgi:hypothetical protein
MKDSAEKRAEDSKSLADKEGALADMKASLENDTDSKKSTTEELMATNMYIQSLHNECDWHPLFYELAVARLGQSALRAAVPHLSFLTYSSFCSLPT